MKNILATRIGRHRLTAALLAALVPGPLAAPAATAEVNLYSYRQPFLIEPILAKFTEETGIEVRITGLVDAFHNPPGAGATVFLLYRAERVSGELRADDDADDAAFFGRDELPPLAFASTFAAVEHLPPPRAGSADPG